MLINNSNFKEPPNLIYNLLLLSNSKFYKFRIAMIFIDCIF